ncbi:MAG: phosphate propanoyltransferase [Candidatus Falkowbacteria bacterium]|nr:MAG: phosphate propanoyltransferase [Candidatus Falkowbacteria bacterium]
MITIPIEVSARHIHLSRPDFELLFGIGYHLALFKNISQTGQYAAMEKVILENGDKKIENIRIVGPERRETQIELSLTEARQLGLTIPLAVSGDIAQAAKLTIIGPQGQISKNCAIIAQRHIHASLKDAEKYHLHDGQIVSVECGTQRAVIFRQVVVRVRADFVWNLHLDTDEANAAGLQGGETGILII